jgi:hypothetical protein
MDRRHFLVSGSKLLLVLPIGSFLLQACYGTTATDGEPAAPPSVSGSNAVYTSSINGDHAHTFAIALALFATPADVRGDTSVDEGHAHSIAISAADLAEVQLGQTVTVTTGTSESHTHVLSIVKLA